MTPAGIETAIFRFVAHLNHCATETYAYMYIFRNETQEPVVPLGLIYRVIKEKRFHTSEGDIIGHSEKTNTYEQVYNTE